MLKGRARPRIPPGSSAATMHRPPSALRKSMAEGEPNDEADEDDEDELLSKLVCTNLHSNPATELPHTVLPTCMVNSILALPTPNC